MAFEYHALYHVLTENGEKTLVDEAAWGKKRLTGDDLVKFNADMDLAYQSIVDGINAGQIIVSDLNETITSASGQQITIEVGKVLKFPGATSKFQFHSKFFEWAEVMKQDPNLQIKVAVWVDETP
jgi:hypothetical protein